MFLPVIEEGKCTNCRACARICPKKVFNEEGKNVAVDLPIYCTGCESCSAVCPLKAIEVKEV